MSYDLKGKTILVTGSTDGLGRLLVLELAHQGANVIIHGRSRDKLDQLLNELKQINSDGYFSSIECDLRQVNIISTTFAQLNKLDILVNNAGIWQEGNTIEESPEKIIEVTNVNLTAPMLISRTLLPVLLKSPFGQILNISSIAGVTLPEGYYHTIYTATKWGLQAFIIFMLTRDQKVSLKRMDLINHLEH